MNDPTQHDYDVVVVGARVAGASTALLMARAGLRVLVLDRARPGTDTLSTHALTRAGVLLLQRWGVLDELIAIGTPPVRLTTFHYGTEISVPVDIDSKVGVDALYAPRRTVLDPVLARAAAAAGAEVRHGCRASSLLMDGDGGVRGVAFVDEDGHPQEASAALTVGADGARSLVARRVGARTFHAGRHAGAMLYGHFPDPGVDGYHWFYEIDATCGIIPTNDDRVCTWVGTSASRFEAALRGDPAAAFTTLLREAAPAFADLFPPDGVETRLHGYGGQPGHLREAAGPGWALVGDAGYFKDPLTAHGITDALRDAEFLAAAVVGGGVAAGHRSSAYQERRDRASMEFADVTERIASYTWDLDEIQAMVREEGRLLAREASELAAADPVTRPE